MGETAPLAPAVKELAAMLGQFPKSRVDSCPSLVGDVASRLERLGISDANPEHVIWLELDDLLRRPLTGNGELLAAGWLLRMRPELTEAQAVADLGGEKVRRMDGVSGTSFRDAVEAGNDGAFRQAAFLCLRKWSPRWQQKDSKSPRGLMMATEKSPTTPRTIAVAEALDAAIQARFDDLAADASLLKRRQKAWADRWTPGNAKPAGSDPGPRRRRVMSLAAAHPRKTATLAAGALALVLVACVTVPALVRSPGAAVKETEVIVYRPAAGLEAGSAAEPPDAGLTCMESNASPRRDAHLCLSRNAAPAWDPCFDAGSDAAGNDVVACAALRMREGGEGSELAPLVMRVSGTTERHGGTLAPLQVPVDAAVASYRPWGLELASREDGRPLTCAVKYDEPLSDLPARYFCGTYELRYALDIQSIVDGADDGAIASFSDPDGYEVFDLNRQGAVWTVRAPGVDPGEYRETDVVRAYF